MDSDEIDKLTSYVSDTHHIHYHLTQQQSMALHPNQQQNHAAMIYIYDNYMFQLIRYSQ